MEKKNTEKKVNEIPFELVGYHYADFVRWCTVSENKIYTRKSKVEFFKAVKNHDITRNYSGETFYKGVRF